MILTARISAHPSERRELAQALLAWAVATRLETGLRTAHVYEDVEAPAVFGVVAEWESLEALETHFRSERFGVLMGALDVLADPPLLAITREDDASRGAALRTIRRVRESGRGAEPAAARRKG